jgi:hypothetical protein
LLGPGESPRWTFWTVGADAASANELAVADTLAPGWHHFAISWDAAAGEKALYIDGAEVARASGAALAPDVGAVIQVGRFSYGGAPAGVSIDDLTIYRRALGAGEVGALAASHPDDSAPTVVRSRRVRLDTNAIDREGGIVAVQLGVDGELADPQPYYDSYHWLLPPVEGPHTLEARYEDRAGNTSIVTRTVLLDLPPRLDLALEPTGPLGATVAISAADGGGPLMMQVSQRSDFAGAGWQPLQGRFFWAWEPALPPRLYVRLRDVGGGISSAQAAGPIGQRVYLPMIQR